MTAVEPQSKIPVIDDVAGLAGTGIEKLRSHHAGTEVV
jgi:hypothetical protein